MGRKRWEGTTAEQRQEYARNLSAVRLKKLSKEERSEIARVAVRARWDKWRAEHPDTIKTKTSAEAHGSEPSSPEQRLASPVKQAGEAVSENKRRKPRGGGRPGIP